MKSASANIPEESAAWEAFILGNNEVMEELYTGHYRELLLVAYRYMRSKEAAEDIVGGIFEKLLLMEAEERARLLQPLKHNARAFLHVLVKNKCLDTLRIIQQREKILGTIRLHWTSLESNEVYKTFTLEVFQLMMDHLQPREKEILQLYLDGYSNEEICVKLDLSYHSVKNNIYEARRKMKVLWKVMMK